MTELKVTSSATQTLPNKTAVALLSPRSTRPIIARLTPERAASSFKLRPAVARSTLSRFPMALSSSFWPIANSRAPRFRELRYFGTPELSLGFAREKLNETVGRDHRRKEIIDALHRRSLLLRLLAGTGVADDDGQIPRIARCPCIALDAPIEMNAGQDDGLDSLAAELERQLGAGKSRLQRQLVELVIPRLDQRAQFADQLTVFLLHLRRKVQSLDPACILDPIEIALRIVLPKNLVADPVERFEIRRFARRCHDFDGGGQAAAFAVFFTQLYAAGIVERLVLADRHVGGWPRKNLGKIEFLPLRCKFGDRIDPAHTGGSAG